ncbi:MAG TPA: DUF6438 domain-containing protein [Flavipsychrobacter sp.]|nr:DUF6438 domain-containing protein [Flavipsychrobacter sp.]
MKKNLFIIVPVLILALTACAQTKKSTSKAKKQMDLEYVSMKRTACFGRCPVYAIELYKDGTLKYHGINFVDDSGVYQKKISIAAAEKMLDKFRQYRIDTCKEQYDLLIADLPGIFYEYTIAGTEHKISNANWGPEFLKELATDMDSLAGTSRRGWKKIN